MKLKVTDMDIATGGVLIAILNQEDARRYDLHTEDRITLKKGSKTITAVVDIAESKKHVVPGKIGLFEEVLDKLNVKNNAVIEIEPQEKPKSISIIKKKLNGYTLTAEEIDTIIKDIVNGSLTDIELAYFVSGCYTKHLDLKETVALTKSTVKHGSELKFKNKIIIDKHCSGGVPGNRTTMLVVPILAAAGLTMPKTSSRSITSPAGTADTMEVLAPVSISLEKTKKIVEKTNGCIVWGGAVDLAAADDKLIRVRHSLSIDPEGLLLASILAKKAAVNSTHVLIDIPVGKDTKIKSKREASYLKRKFIKIGRKLGMKVKVIISDGTEPIGNGIGPVLEARDALWVLNRDKRRPLDLEKKSLDMSIIIMKMAGVKNAYEKAKEILYSGKAYEKMKEMIKAQGGNPNINPDTMRLGKYSHTLKASKSGLIYDLDNIAISKIARVAGAPLDKEAGIYLYKHEMQKVKKGEDILTIYSDSEKKLKYALNMLKRTCGVIINGHKVVK